MNKKNTSSLNLEMLIKAGTAEEKKVQQIKSIIPNASSNLESSTDPEEVIAEIEQSTNIEDIANTPEIKDNKPTTKKGIEILLAKRELEDTEGIKIPRHIHRELKTLTGITGCTMMQMISNILEDFLKENEKEIIAYKKKYVNSILGKK